MDYADRPRYYQGRGRLRGSYTRVGDSDEPMTEYEVYLEPLLRQGVLCRTLPHTPKSTKQKYYAAADS